MARKYELKRRAKRQEETRLRIVEAAIELHGTIGPARTTVSDVAARAGVQRHTYYRHFPDERSLFLACSGLAMERNPLPDPEPWRAIADPIERLRAGLTELYAYFASNEDLLAHAIRDAEIDPATREIAELRFGPPLAAIRAALGDGLAPAGLDLALDFNTWRLLAGRDRDAVETMVAVLRCLSRS